MIQTIIAILGTLSGWIAFFFSRAQLKTARQELALSISKAQPKISARVWIDKRNENGTNYPPFYYLMASIHNDGELAAQRLKGKCALLSPDKHFNDRTLPIEADYLGAVPYQLEPCRIEGLGSTLNAAMRGELALSLKVDIELTFTGIPDDKPQQYSAHYHWDTETRQLLKM